MLLSFTLVNWGFATVPMTSPEAANWQLLFEVGNPSGNVTAASTNIELVTV